MGQALIKYLRTFSLNHPQPGVGSLPLSAQLFFSMIVRTMTKIYEKNLSTK